MKTILFLLLVLYNFIDAYQTWLLLNLGYEELNPVLNYIIINFGFRWAVFNKVLALMFFGITILIYHKHKERIK